MAAPNNHNHHQAQRPASIPAPRSQQQPQAPVTAPRTARTPQTAQAPVPAPQVAAVAPSVPSMAHTPQTDPQQPQTAVTAPRETAAFVEALPGGIGHLDVPRLAHLVATAQTEGWTLPALRQHLVTHVDATRVYAHATVYEKHLRNLPTRSASPAAPAAAQPVWWECSRDDCGRLSKATRPDDGVCTNCRQAGAPAEEKPTCPGRGSKPCGRPVVAGADMCGRCGCAVSAATARR